MIWFVAGMAGLLAGIAAVRLLVQPPSGLRLTVFRPWREDPWPRGVQEDDDARFDWEGPAKRRRAAIRLGWEERTMEELPSADVSVEPIDPGHVHRRPH
jgi:hypothetical protein